MKKYQVAIIGTNIGAKHFEDFQKVSERFDIHTLCGLTREAIDKILRSNTKTKVGYVGYLKQKTFLNLRDQKLTPVFLCPQVDPSQI